MTIEPSTEAVVAKPDKPTTAAVEQELVGRLVAQAREQGLELTGDGGLLAELTKQVLTDLPDVVGAGVDRRSSRETRRRQCRGPRCEGPAKAQLPRDDGGGPAAVPQPQRRRCRSAGGPDAAAV